MASSISPLTSQPTASTSSPTSSSSNLSTPPTESMFLNLLVAQIQNQDPLNPSDSTQFVSQLAQFSDLEQVIAIRGDTDSMASEMKSTAAAAATTTPGATPAPTTPTLPSAGQTPTNGTTQA